MADGIFAFKEIGERETVAIEELLAVRVEDGETGARHGHGHAAEDGAVDHFGLREISHFGGTEDGSGGRQDGILHHRAQQGVG